MSETVEIDKATCSTCDAVVRENTQFCYNCGSKLELASPVETNGTAVVNDNAKAALDDLADKLSHVESDDKLAKAASERKKARVTQRKRLEYRWEPRDDAPIVPVIFASFVAFAALIVVILLVIWK